MTPRHKRKHYQSGWRRMLSGCQMGILIGKDNRIDESLWIHQITLFITSYMTLCLLLFTSTYFLNISKSNA
jgi:hypothetical protein